MPGVDMVSLVQQIATSREHQIRYEQLRQAVNRGDPVEAEVNELLASCIRQIIEAADTAWTTPGKAAKLSQARAGLMTLGMKAQNAVQAGVVDAAPQHRWCYALVWYLDRVTSG